jgi:formiminotetrahydrofolate cyclodeaminase
VAQSHPATIASLRVDELIGAIGSDEVSPGSGAASAVCLALAVACATKAAAISLKHSPDDEALRTAEGQFKALCDQALQAGDRDSAAFERFVQEKTPNAAEHLIRTDEQLGALARQLLVGLDTVKSRIHCVVAGDVMAARTLAQAALVIEQSNVAETRSSGER